MLVAEASQLQGKVRFVGVDTRDSPSDAAAFLRQMRVSYLQLADPQGRLLAKAGIPGLPVTYFLDARGAVRYRQVGQLHPDQLAAGLVTIGIRPGAP